MRKGLLLFVVFVVAAAFLNPLPALAAAYQDKPKAVKTADPAGQLMMITGTIESGPDGYSLEARFPRKLSEFSIPTTKCWPRWPRPVRPSKSKPDPCRETTSTSRKSTANFTWAAR